jgi:hypothetical protein
MKIRYVALIFLAIVAVFYITTPSEEDLVKCSEHTGWSKDRCNYELTR